MADDQSAVLNDNPVNEELKHLAPDLEGRVGEGVLHTGAEACWRAAARVLGQLVINELDRPTFASLR